MSSARNLVEALSDRARCAMKVRTAQRWHENPRGPAGRRERTMSNLRKFVTGSGKQSRFVGQLTGMFQPVRSGIKFSPAAEQAISASLEPLFAKLLKSGKITSNIYGPEHANSFTRKFVSAAIKAVEEERNR